MSIRARVFAIVILMAITIITFGIGIGLVFVQGHLEQSIEADMAEVGEIADKLITTEINLLKADASMVARHVFEAAESDIPRVLREQVETYARFIGLTVIDHNGIAASYGLAATPEQVRASEYIPKAFAGEAVISTTRPEAGGGLVFHVCVPMEGRVLSATVPGMFFRDIISDFTIWETGNIFILDHEGTVIADINSDLVTRRYSSIASSKTDSRQQGVADIAGHMIRGESGVGKYSMYGRDRLCVYRPITGSKVGWSLGVVAPLEESPLKNMRSGLFLVWVVCLLLSLAASVIASAVLERPYQKTNLLLASLKYKEKLLHTINDVAVLLKAESDDLAGNILKSMDMMARCAEVDRMRIYQNSMKNGELCRSQIYEWSEGAEPQTGKGVLDVPYGRTLPGWEKKLSAGEIINAIVRNLSPEEQAQLRPRGLCSFLVIPLIFKNNFWGFAAFDDCRREREFSTDEEELLQSGGLLIASAIFRREMTSELVSAREEAVASAAAKSDFLANISHEMRTPLNAIIGLSDLALDTYDLQGAARENIEKVYSSGVTLLSLINDILDISKIESGKFELIPAEYDTPSLINDTVTLNILRIGSKPITFNLQVDKTLPGRLVGDELRLKQIFNNLLSNAFK
ncbi:MAG: GAF domain-containing protein, partial [Candidatus Adiutrix sp.]|nr:GAF domain-containing protein [Candidatus Adiutrix sp.]